MANYTYSSLDLTSPEHTHSRQPDLYAAVISTSVVAFIAVNLRLLARKLSRASYGLDDLLIVLGLINLGALIYIAIWALREGFGLPWTAVEITSAHDVLRKVFYAEFLYTTLLSLVKFSVLSFYWRCFDVRHIRWAISVLAVLVAGWTIAVICTYLLQCKPIEEFWIRSDPWACSAVDQKIFMIWSAIPNIITDVGLLVLPMFPIWDLRKNLKQKIALSVVFGLGSITLFASVARLVAAIRADFVALNVSWTLVDFLMWSIIEAATAVIAANLPFLKPLYKALADKAQQSRNSWASRRSSKLSSQSSRYTISTPRSVRGSQLRTLVHTRSYSGSSYSHDGCDVMLIPVEMLGKYESLNESPMNPVVGVDAANVELQSLDKAVMRTRSRDYVWN